MTTLSKGSDTLFSWMWQHQKAGLSFLHRNMRLCHETLFILSPTTSGIRGRRCFWFTLIMQSIGFWLTRVHVGTHVTKYFIFIIKCNVFCLMVSNSTVIFQTSTQTAMIVIVENRRWDGENKGGLFPIRGSLSGFNVQPSRIPRQFFHTQKSTQH